MWGVPDVIVEQARERLPEDLLGVVYAFRDLMND